MTFIGTVIIYDFSLLGCLEWSLLLYSELSSLSTFLFSLYSLFWFLSTGLKAELGFSDVSLLNPVIWKNLFYSGVSGLLIGWGL
jgi:hypothetical protein